MNRKTIASTVAAALVVTAGLYAAKKVPWDEAQNYYGQTVTVTGKVVVAHNTGKVCFLNFHRNWKRYFTAVIFAADFDKFPERPEDCYLNKTVEVTGPIKEYKGKPEIVLKDPGQIVIVEDVPTPEPPLAGVDLHSQVALLRRRVDVLEGRIEKLEKLLESKNGRLR
jgi:aspartyl/asparaginyl-tRNA synthetase